LIEHTRYHWTLTEMLPSYGRGNEESALFELGRPSQFSKNSVQSSVSTFNECIRLYFETRERYLNEKIGILIQGLARWRTCPPLVFLQHPTYSNASFVVAATECDLNGVERRCTLRNCTVQRYDIYVQDDSCRASAC
jgi:hypothetical protein